MICIETFCKGPRKRVGYERSEFGFWFPDIVLILTFYANKFVDYLRTPSVVLRQPSRQRSSAVCID